MSSEVQDLTRLDRVIHEPARLGIMLVLHGAGEADFLYLQRECGLTQGNLSSHLARLEETGYVEIEKKFKGKFPMTVCRLSVKGKAAFDGYTEMLAAVLQVVRR
ncbi:MAG TPA: transcriptional regulator [Verrucomicrobiae bacterium]|nr:transcriptional regulator [Verrucomicrobiae bacterium]